MCSTRKNAQSEFYKNWNVFDYNEETIQQIRFYYKKLVPPSSMKRQFGRYLRRLTSPDGLYIQQYKPVEWYIPKRSFWSKEQVFYGSEHLYESKPGRTSYLMSEFTTLRKVWPFYCVSGTRPPTVKHKHFVETAKYNVTDVPSMPSYLADLMDDIRFWISRTVEQVIHHDIRFNDAELESRRLPTVCFFASGIIANSIYETMQSKELMNQCKDAKSCIRHMNIVGTISNYVDYGLTLAKGLKRLTKDTTLEYLKVYVFKVGERSHDFVALKLKHGMVVLLDAYACGASRPTWCRMMFEVDLIEMLLHLEQCDALQMNALSDIYFQRPIIDREEYYNPPSDAFGRVGYIEYSDNEFLPLSQIRNDKVIWGGETSMNL